MQRTRMPMNSIATHTRKEAMLVSNCQFMSCDLLPAATEKSRWRRCNNRCNGLQIKVTNEFDEGTSETAAEAIAHRTLGHTTRARTCFSNSSACGMCIRQCNGSSLSAIAQHGNSTCGFSTYGVAVLLFWFIAPPLLGVIIVTRGDNHERKARPHAIPVAVSRRTGTRREIWLRRVD